jgi:hypothetical protein
LEQFPRPEQKGNFNYRSDPLWAGRIRLQNGENIMALTIRLQKPSVFPQKTRRTGIKSPAFDSSFQRTEVTFRRTDFNPAKTGVSSPPTDSSPTSKDTARRLAWLDGVFYFVTRPSLPRHLVF